MIAGGASFAPSLWSFAADAIDARRRSACKSTALIAAQRNVRNCQCVCGSEPGLSKFTPVSVAIDQLLCLPDPLTPANGFSCMRHAKPWAVAVVLSICIKSI